MSAPGAPRLGSDEVHVWSARLDPTPATLAALAGSLTDAERALAERRVAERLRTRALASRGFLRAVLGRYLGCPPEAVALVQGARGKPMLGTVEVQAADGSPDARRGSESAAPADRDARPARPDHPAAATPRAPFRAPTPSSDAAPAVAHPPVPRNSIQGAGQPPVPASELRFNLSHADDFALLALALGRAVGVDVEPADRRVDLEPIAERFFAPAERAALFALPPTARLAGFLELWTRKEAYLKARGDGLRADLAAFAATLGPHPRLTPIGDALDADGWTIRHLEPAPGFVAALVVRGRAPVSVRSFAWRG